MVLRLKYLVLLALFCGIGVCTTARSGVSGQASAPFRVYLTFEDGPTSAYTPAILDTLAQYGAHASFVINGAQIAGHEALIQRELREGHALVNHLWGEPGVYAGAPAETVLNSYVRTETALREAIGPELLPLYDQQTKLFWQPGGAAQPFPATAEVQVIHLQLEREQR